MKVVSVGITLFLWTAPLLAHQAQEGRVVATAGLFVHQTQAVYSQDSTNSPLSAGLGLLAEGDLNSSGGIEIGLFYGNKPYQRTSGSNHIVEKVEKLDVPIGYRYWFVPSLSGSLAFSSLFSVGDTSVLFNNVTTGDVTSAEDSMEYGTEASVQWEFAQGTWADRDLNFLIEATYFYSLSAKPHEDANQLGLFLGAKYQIQ